MAKELYQFINRCNRDHISAFAAQAAYFVLLSLIPFLLFFATLLKYTPVTLEFLEQNIILVMPDYLTDFFVAIMREVYMSSAGLLSVSAIVAIYSAAKGIQYLTNGLNTMYDLPETRNWFQMRFWSAVYTVLLIFSIIFMLVVLVFGQTLKYELVKHWPALNVLLSRVMQLRGLVGIVVLTEIVNVFYFALPNRNLKKIQSRKVYLEQLPGALLCAVAWYFFSKGVSIYVDYFHGFSGYGSLTTIVLLMFWLYFYMYILLMCAEINHIYVDQWIEIWKRKRKK